MSPPAAQSSAFGGQPIQLQPFGWTSCATCQPSGAVTLTPCACAMPVQQVLPLCKDVYQQASGVGSGIVFLSGQQLYFNVSVSPPLAQCAITVPEGGLSSFSFKYGGYWEVNGVSPTGNNVVVTSNAIQLTLSTGTGTIFQDMYGPPPSYPFALIGGMILLGILLVVTFAAWLNSTLTKRAARLYGDETIALTKEGDAPGEARGPKASV